MLLSSHQNATDSHVGVPGILSAPAQTNKETIDEVITQHKPEHVHKFLSLHG